MFPSTHHSLLADLQGSSEPLRREALDRLVEVYWKPAYKYIRVRWRREPADAEDLAQGFFAALLERQMVSRFEPSRGSFHSFLRVCIDNFTRDEDRRGRAGHRLTVDCSGAEAELAAAGEQVSPEELFHRDWQRQIFALAIGDLHELSRQQGKSVQFAIFQEHDLAAARPSYAELAARHGVAVTQVTNYLSWARRELRRLAVERMDGVTEPRLLLEP